MTAEELISYLKSPEKLIHVSLEELKELVNRFPYSQNLKYLLLRKARQIEDPNEKLYEQSCAVSTYDRQHLYQLLQNYQETPNPIIPHTTPKPESAMALSNEVKDKVKPIQISNYPPASKETEKVEQADYDSENLIVEGMRFEKMMEEQQITLSSDVDKFVDKFMSLEQGGMTLSKSRSVDLQADTKFLQEIHVVGAKAEPAPKSTFSSWLSTLKSPKVTSHRIDDFIVPSPTQVTEPPSKPEKPKNVKPKKTTEKTVAEKSLVESDEIFSENLADLLAAQGHNKRAILMYEKLILKFPQKSSYFAKKIEKLKI